MERHRGVSPGGGAPFPGENVSQHLRNGALRGSISSYRQLRVKGRMGKEMKGVRDR